MRGQAAWRTDKTQRSRASRPIALGSTTMLADRSGALYWQDERLLIVADLHLEKGSAFARRGQMLPPYDSRATLTRLAAVVAAYEPRTVVALGDSFHDAGGASRLAATDLALLTSLQEGRTWIWVAGNHDPVHDGRAGGEAAGEIDICGLTLRHEPRAGVGRPEIAGHLHPAARLVWNGASVRARCFASDAQRIVMPAFGAFAGGLNVISEPFAPLFGGRPAAVHMLGSAGLYPVPPRALIGD